MCLHQRRYSNKSYMWLWLWSYKIFVEIMRLRCNTVKINGTYRGNWAHLRVRECVCVCASVHYKAKINRRRTRRKKYHYDNLIPCVYGRAWRHYSVPCFGCWKWISNEKKRTHFTRWFMVLIFAIKVRMFKLWHFSVAFFLPQSEPFQFRPITYYV